MYPNLTVPLVVLVGLALGLLPFLLVRNKCATATATRNGHQVAQPRTLVWDMDFPSAERFGGSAAASGIFGPSAGAGEVVLNDLLAADLGVRPGDLVTLYLYDKPRSL